MLLKRLNPCLGRSMIEMLGVLNIIAILCIGGITAYSKTVESYKITKLIQEYNTFVFNLLEYRAQFVHDFPNGHGPVHNKTFSILGLLPDKWKQDYQPAYLRDSYGNYVSVLWDCHNIQGCGYVLETRIGASDKEKRAKNLCIEMLKTFVKPLHNIVIYGRGTFGQTPVYYGDALCGSKNRPCLNNLSLDEINTICASCKGGFGNNCAFSIVF